MLLNNNRTRHAYCLMFFCRIDLYKLRRRSHGEKNLPDTIRVSVTQNSERLDSFTAETNIRMVNLICVGYSELVYGQ